MKASTLATFREGEALIAETRATAMSLKNTKVAHKIVTAITKLEHEWAQLRNNARVNNY